MSKRNCQTDLPSTAYERLLSSERRRRGVRFVNWQSHLGCLDGCRDMVKRRGQRDSGSPGPCGLAKSEVLLQRESQVTG